MTSDIEKKDLVLVEWEDSVQPTSSWCFLEDAPSLEVIQCVSVGWVLGQNDRMLMIASNIGDVDSGNSAQGSGIIRIPRSAVMRIAKLDEATSYAYPSFRPEPEQKPLSS